MANFGSYFDQEEPEIEVIGLIADLDINIGSDVESVGVFKAKNRKYLIVYICGCSCWPDKGITTQFICNTKVEVDRILRKNWAELRDKFQQATFGK